MKDFLNLKKPFRGFLMLTLMVYALSSIFCAQLSAQNLQRKIDFSKAVAKDCRPNHVGCNFTAPAIV